MNYKVKNTQIAPTGRLEVLSGTEATKLLDSGHGTLHQLYRNCSLAVLNTGNELDDAQHRKRFRDCMAYAARPLAQEQVDGFLAAVEDMASLPDARRLVDLLIA